MIISICNEKGGSGKSTLVTNLAIALYNKEKKNLVIDADPQKSIASFVAIRNEENHIKKFDLACRVGDDFKNYLLDNNKLKEYDFILCDTGGRDSREMRIALALSDIVIIPTIPSQFDVSVLDKMIEIVKMAKETNPKLIAYIVINRASTNPFLQKKIDYLQSYIKELEQDYIKLLDLVIYEREKYKISTQMGLGVTENGKSKASDEIEEFVKLILGKSI